MRYVSPRNDMKWLECYSVNIDVFIESSLETPTSGVVYITLLPDRGSVGATVHLEG
jgi:hypothetical protein